MVQSHGELNHKLTSDRHVHDGPVTGGSGVLIHDVHMLVGVEVRDIKSLGPEFRENEAKTILSHYLLVCAFLTNAVKSKFIFPIFRKKEFPRFSEV